jgi:tetratricopeptide (TPR) repeat protein
MIPLLRATKLLKENKTGHWAHVHDRIFTHCDPKVSEKFVIKQGASIFTIGSCFARNMEQHLSKLGFVVPMLDFFVPEHERAGGRAQSVLNKYTPPSISQEIEWTSRVLKRDSTVVWEDCENFLYIVGNDQWVDGGLAGFVPVSRDRAIERRQDIFNVFKHVFTSDCITITLGLNECWFDRDRLLYVQQCPVSPIGMYRNYKDSMFFEQLDYEESLSHMVKSIDLISSLNPNAKILLTVSPVPLGSTFSDEDIILANSYSKSVLRAVAGKIVSTYDNVGYFPSFEKVTLTRDWSVYEGDLRHVSDEAVADIVFSLMDSYLDIDVNDAEYQAQSHRSKWGKEKNINALISKAELSIARSDFKEAARMFGKAAEIEDNKRRILNLKTRYLSMLIRSNEWEKAVNEAEHLIEERNESASVYFLLSIGKYETGDISGALNAAKKANLLNSKRSDIRRFLDKISKSVSTAS